MFVLIYTSIYRYEIDSSTDQITRGVHVPKKQSSAFLFTR